MSPDFSGSSVFRCPRALFRDLWVVDEAMTQSFFCVFVAVDNPSHTLMLIIRYLCGQTDVCGTNCMNIVYEVY